MRQPRGLNRLFPVVLVAGVIGGAGGARAEMSLREAVAKDYRENLAALFDHFHRNPELSFQETKTSERLAAEIRALGYEVTTGVGGTGVVAVLKNGAGPVVMVRADMDGLPVEEKTGLAYASKARQVDLAGVDQPVMHACGHDVHMTALVGTAKQMMARKAEWSGTLVLIGQPAEEKVGGARAMLKDGLYARFPKPEYALAFHVAADLPSGRVEVPTHTAYSGADSVEIVVRGVASHGAAPQKSVDPVVLASQIVVSLQTLVSRSISPFTPGVVTVGAIHGGARGNIIPDSVTMLLTVRSEDAATRKTLLDGIDRVCKGAAIAMGVPSDRMPEVKKPENESTPPTINHTATAERVRALIAAALGEGRMIDKARENMGAEDFAYFVAPETGVKGVYFRVGGTPEREVATAAAHHSGLFKIEPEPAVVSGIEAMTAAAMGLMPRGAADGR